MTRVDIHSLKATPLLAATAGSAPSRPTAATSDTRPSGDAALQSLLMALPEAASTAVPVAVGCGVCPPLFKPGSGSSKEAQGASVPQQQQQEAAAGEDVVMGEAQAASSPPKRATQQLKVRIRVVCPSK